MTERELRALAASIELPGRARPRAGGPRSAAARRAAAPARARGRPRGRARSRSRSPSPSRRRARRSSASSISRERRSSSSTSCPTVPTSAAARPRRSAHPRGRARAHRRLPAARRRSLLGRSRRGHLGRAPALVPVRAGRGCSSRSCSASERAELRQEGRPSPDHDHARSSSTGSRVTSSPAPALPLPGARRGLVREERDPPGRNVLLWQHGPLTLRLEGNLTLAESACASRARSAE